MKAKIWGPAEDEKELVVAAGGPYLSRVAVLARQHGLAEVHAVGVFGSPGLDLRADVLVVLLQELHGWDVPNVEEGRREGCRVMTGNTRSFTTSVGRDQNYMSRQWNISNRNTLSMCSIKINSLMKACVFILLFFIRSNMAFSWMRQ